MFLLARTITTAKVTHDGKRQGSPMLTNSLQQGRYNFSSLNPPTPVELTAVDEGDVEDHLEFVKKLGIVDRENLYWMFQRFVMSCQLYN